MQTSTTPAPSGRSTTAAVAFLDMSGFTALTEVHGDLKAADLAEQLAMFARAALDESDRVVKTLGDAVLLTSPTPGSALGLIRRILERWSVPDAGIPILRGGLHYGPVVERHDDIYGATVNLAARVADAAVPDQILLTAPVAAHARAEGLPITAVGPLTFRNVTDPVDVFALDIECLCGVVDPVCRMRVRPEDATPVATVGGSAFYFCSTACADRFAAAPDRFIDPIACGTTDPRRSPRV